MSRYEKTLATEQVVGRLKDAVEAIVKNHDLMEDRVRVRTAFGFDRMANPGYFAQVWVEGTPKGSEPGEGGGYYFEDYYLPGLDGMTDGEDASRCIRRLEKFSLGPLFQQLYPEGWSAMCADLPF